MPVLSLEEKNRELRDAMNRLIGTLATKTQTIEIQRQHLDVLFQSLETICDLVQTSQFDQLTDLVSMYKSLQPKHRSRMTH